MAPALAGFGADEVGTLLTSWEADAERHAKARTEAKAEANRRLQAWQATNQLRLDRDRARCCWEQLWLEARQGAHSRVACCGGSCQLPRSPRTRRTRSWRRAAAATELLLPTSALVEPWAARRFLHIAHASPRAGAQPALRARHRAAQAARRGGGCNGGGRRDGGSRRGRGIADTCATGGQAPRALVVSAARLTASDKEMVVLDPAWARMCLLSAMGAEAAVRVQRRLHVGANAGVTSSVEAARVAGRGAGLPTGGVAQATSQQPGPRRAMVSHRWHCKARCLTTPCAAPSCCVPFGC